MLFQVSDPIGSPKISIVIPSFNQARYLGASIESVLSQGYPDLELIIIDGGSTDGSKDIIQRYELQLKYWVSEPDKGQSDAINKGFQKCTGDLITFLSSDDYYLPGAFFFAAEQWQKHPDCGAIVGGFRHADEYSKLSPIVNVPRLPHPSPLDLTLIAPEDWRMHQVSTFYSRKALDQVGRHVREDLRYVMDRDLLFRIANKFEIVMDNRPYAAFRRHPESKTMSEMISFGEEFARLYTENHSTNVLERKQREQTAHFLMAKGHFSVAKYHPNLLTSLSEFLSAARIYPRYLLTKSYWSGIVKRILNGGS